MPARKPATDTRRLLKSLEQNLDDLASLLNAPDLTHTVIASLLTHQGAADLFNTCENCGKPFIPRTTRPARYCNRPAPQSPSGSQSCVRWGSVQDYRIRCARDVPSTDRAPAPTRDAGVSQAHALTA